MVIGPRGVQTAIVTTLFAILGTFFVALRLWTRFVIIRAPGLEDVVLVVSWLCAVSTQITTGFQISNGLGEHGNTLQPRQVENLLLSLYIGISTYCASVGLTKIAILLQYQRVFSTRRFQIVCWTMIAAMIAYTIATVAACIFICTPVQKFWKGGDGTCINELASWFSNAVINIITDFMIIILPMPVIKRLSLKNRQKYLLMGVFAFGGVVCIISIVRLHSLLVIATSTDQTYDNAGVATFSIVETNVAIICACLPALKPLLAQWFTGLGNSRGTHGSSGPNSHGGKRSSVLQLATIGSMNTRKGARRLEGDDLEGDDDKIRVVTRVDVRVSGQGDVPSVRDGRESSTETLFRNARDAGHVV